MACDEEMESSTKRVIRRLSLVTLLPTKKNLTSWGHAKTALKMHSETYENGVQSRAKPSLSPRLDLSGNRAGGFRSRLCVASYFGAVAGTRNRARGYSTGSGTILDVAGCRKSAQVEPRSLSEK